ncbi:DUF6884 domain-containing protein [Salinigranum halophilum]|uniref:DUF6884 domain-containing protein n=1 Tax=Salinigranum halophilum TaxID=2565931 RepID=UPI001F3A7F34|nr:DUF6884 domain-containing protein [Salinigranum halophilum]
MRFYVPEWDDAVDAHYDFEHDELSELDRDNRELNYIWDIFGPETTPIDGVLISREQVETSDRKFARLTSDGVYEDDVLSVPDWLPTISDCGAWGYKSLPFPPYGNKEMLDFYDELQVTTGVTIDHLVLGSGKDMGRLYLDKRAFGDGFKQSDIPDSVTDVVDVMIDEWPDEWPPYVDKYEPSIRTSRDEDVPPFTREDFEGDVETVLSCLDDDSRAVYREDDKQFRYDLTLRNAREMYDLYQNGPDSSPEKDYRFRLMVAIQGWDTESYRTAASEVLDLGYDYLGIGGVAGSPIHEVRKIVKGVGKTIKEFERTRTTRVDSHVFGFAKTEAFETIGRSGMTSFDSASMLRSAWTGGENYRLDTEERYDAIRVRYSSPGDNLSEAIEKSLRGRETLVALRAYAAEESISDALRDWEHTAEKVLPETRQFLRNHRHDTCYDESRLRDVETALRERLTPARELQASFSDDLRGKLIKLLRADDPEDSLPFAEYEELLDQAESIFESFPRMQDELEGMESATPLEQVWTVVKDYAEWIGDEDLLEEYYETLAARPWEKCDCRICGDTEDPTQGHGIEVCIFRGNDRNRRRGFHNTKRFYDQFAEALPKILVVSRGTDDINQYERVQEYLAAEQPEFWSHIHDLPVAEIGVVDKEGVREWWTDTDTSGTPNPPIESLTEHAQRYQHLFVHTPTQQGLSDETRTTIEETGCDVTELSEATALRETVLEACGDNYAVGRDFLPHPPEIETKDGLDVLVIDQCSGSKNVPETAPVFGAEETLKHSRKELLNRENVLGIEARDLYAGRQQEYITNAVRQLRRAHDVDRYFISAGFGLVKEDEKLPPYEVTFSSMKVSEIRDRSERLHIKQDVQRLVHESSYDVVFFTLGKDYYTSIDIDEMVQQVPANRIGVVFNRELVEEQFENIVSVPARTEDAKNHGTIVIGLKGRYMEHFARRVDAVDTLTPARIEELCRRIDEEPTQTGFGSEDEDQTNGNDESTSSETLTDESTTIGPQAVYDALVGLSELSAETYRELEFDELTELLAAFGIDSSTVTNLGDDAYLVQPEGPHATDFVVLCGTAVSTTAAGEGPVRAKETPLPVLAEKASDDERFRELENPLFLDVNSNQVAVYSDRYQQVIYLHDRTGDWEPVAAQVPLSIEVATELYEVFSPLESRVSQTQLESF